MRMYEIIEKKRDGYELSFEEIEFFIQEYCKDNIPDYQASALLMAIFIKGMSERETADLTNIMANSGEKVDLSEIPGIKVDKHSTGGVGDKTTLILAPIVAACGVPVAKMSGRGLGHTGGTIDKLEAIPNFNTGISIENFIKNIKEIGVCIAGQTGNLAPADKKLYALRDVTATVNNLSLIASSVMSKKLASGADKIVLDVKTGSGAFMKTKEDAVRLAQTMVKIGKNTGRNVVAIITDMDVPLGKAIGNSLEVIEAIETLKNRGPEDLRKVSFDLAAMMLELSGIGDLETCYKKVEEVVENGKALEKFKELVEKQGGDTAVIDDYSLFPKVTQKVTFVSKHSGHIQSMKTDTIGIAALELGAGRETKESMIDYGAGIILNKKTGDYVRQGEVIATLFTNKKDKLEKAALLLEQAIVINNGNAELNTEFSRKLEPKPLIQAYIDINGAVRNKLIE